MYYVGASVIVSLQSAEGGQYFPKELDLIYETIEITSVNGNPYPGTTDLGKSKFELALIVVIPLVVAMILMLLALRYCIKRYRGAVPTSMVEE